MPKVVSPSNGKRVKVVIKNTDLLDRDPDDEFQTMPYTGGNTDAIRRKSQDLEYGEQDTVAQLEQILAQEEQSRGQKKNQEAEIYLNQMRDQAAEDNTIEQESPSAAANIVIKDKDFSAVRRGVDSESPSREIRDDIKDIVKTFDSTEIGVLLSQVEEELQERAKKALRTISPSKDKVDINDAQMGYLKGIQDTLN